MMDDLNKLTVEDLYSGSDRRIAEALYSKKELRKYDEATLRLEAKNSPNFGPTGDCPCGGVLVYLCRQEVHYCALCNTEYPENNGSPVITRGRRLEGGLP